MPPSGRTRGMEAAGSTLQIALRMESAMADGSWCVRTSTLAPLSQRYQ